MLKQQFSLPLFLAVLVVLMIVELLLSSDKAGSLRWDAFFLAILFVGVWARRKRQG
jgi:hypothetical protein